MPAVSVWAANSSVEDGGFKPIPTPLKSGLFRSNVTLENYLALVLQPLRSYGEDKNSLSLSDVEQVFASIISLMEVEKAQKYIRYDLNRDAKITATEIETALSEAKAYSSSFIQKKIEEMMESDINDDGAISYQEMWTLTEKERDDKKRFRNYNKAKEYIQLDPNKDGVLTLEELTDLAKNAFYLIDKDKSSHISSAEMGAYYERQREARSKK